MKDDCTHYVETTQNVSPLKESQHNKTDNMKVKYNWCTNQFKSTVGIV